MVEACIAKEIRTPRTGVMIGTRGKAGALPVAVVKHGKKTDTMSLDEFASALYGRRVKCHITLGEDMAEV